MKRFYGPGLFVLGAVLTWFAKPEKTAPPVVENTRVRPAAPSRPERFVRKTDPKIESYLDELVSSKWQDRNKHYQLLGKAADNQLAEIVKAYAKRAGIAGLSDPDRENFEWLLMKWYLKDSAAALAWANSQENANDRRKFLIKMVEMEVKNPRKALAMIEEHGVTFEGEYVPYEIQEHIYQMPLDEMLATMAKLRAEKGNRRYFDHINLEFPEDFDFSRFAKELEKLKAGLPEDQSLACIPPFIGPWARNDPKAAWEYVKAVEKIDFNGPLYQFFQEYTKDADPAEIGQLAAELPVGQLYSNESWTRHSALMVSENPETVDAFLQTAPEGREKAVLWLLQSGLGSSGGNSEQRDELVISRLTPEERMTLIPRAAEGKDSLQKISRLKSLQSLLSRLGHTEQEINAMLPPPKKSK